MRLARAVGSATKAATRPVAWSGLASSRAHVNGAQPLAQPGAGAAAEEQAMVTVHFVDPNVEGLPRRHSVQAPVGSSIVDVAKAHGIDIHAACGQKLQCATCHVILEKNYFDTLQRPGVREEDLLDSTFTLTSTSRLGCQVRLTPKLDGIQLTLPDNGSKGNVRMSLDQPRPKVEMKLPGIPAVAPRPSRRQDVGAFATSAGLASRGEVNEIQQRLEEQRNLSTRLEAELRQIRASALRMGGGSESSSSKKPAANATDSSGKSADDDQDDLEKLKAELQATRVDVSKLGRRACFDDVIGLDAAKLALREAVIWPAVADPALFSGIRGGPKGLLLYGPPGCGKTMLARAAAVELDGRASFFHVRPGDVMSKFYGDSQRRVQALEEVVREAAPAVVFFDEVDSLLGSRDGGNVAEHHRSTTNALLSWMDGFGTGDERIFFLGATNRAEAIDEAALRRFGEAAEVGAPCAEARLALIRLLVLEKAAADGHQFSLSDSDLEAISEKTAAYSLADVDRLVRRSFLQVVRELPQVKPGLHPADVPPVTLGHFLAAMDASSGTSALREMLRKRAEKRAPL
eukprot:TRINITY_DN87166_c0_g1_i1.p1 TRINITY_DN87166_c0_g1~~TRINITY_DN87166_c0_g1_i1.p1  ORF type:complete len:573 (+),score=141.47 TRINITY_DN87166_c0_g1_i1:147-1865(+)